MKNIFEGTSASGFGRSLVRILLSPKFIVIVAVVLLLTSFGLWRYNETTSQNRIFWNMVDQSLKTSSFSRHSFQKNAGQSVEQSFHTVTSPEDIVFSKTTFTQSGVDSATAVTENIGTPTADYVRYTKIETAQKTDYSKLIGLWGKSDAATDTTQGQAYNESVLSVVPYGNLDAAQRRELIKLMKDKKAYEFNKQSTEYKLPFGRPVHTMQITVNPVGYISALKQYAAYSGLTHLQDVDPAAYEKSAKIPFTVKIDGWSGRIIEIVQRGGKIETLTGFNLRKSLPNPPADKETISVDELQNKLQNAQ